MGHFQALPVLEAWLTAYFARRLGLESDQIDPTQVFTYYGLASIEALHLVRELEQWLGCTLPPTLAWTHPSIVELARYLAGDPAVSQRASELTPATESTPQAVPEPIAIVGLGCRFPNASSLEAFWQLLCEGQEAITIVPPERWDITALFDPDPARPGKTVSRWGGFLNDLDKFDASFFGISPREAPHIDPRQRLMLEVAWEAIEDAGIPVEALAGTNTGVFVATLSNDYDQLLYRDLDRVEAYSGPGTANSIVANRLSYCFDLHGPSLSLDTACSGSLIAIHLACQSLRLGECDLALAGGVSINLLPNGNVFFTKAGALSPDGHCKTFGSQANGIVRSEGAGLIVLKRLSRAQADGDRLYAVILGSAVNQDGHSNGLMAPNGRAQAEVLREAYRRAQVSPGSVQYIEAHGTGTPLGDPIEVQALSEILSRGRRPDHQCVLGSLKSNLGHMEPASGVAGVIKTALAIKRRCLPPSLHCQTPNPLIPFGQLPFVVPDRLRPWPADTEPLIAGVSGFGFGGTNAHIVLAEAPAAPSAPAAEMREGWANLLPLSARSESALKDFAEAYQQYLTAPEVSAAWGDICYSASLRRSHHREYRLALVARSKAEAADTLAAFVRNEVSPRWTAGSQEANKPPKIVFVFSGQGSHWARMGCELFDQEPVFRATLQECDRLLRQLVCWSLLEELGRPAEESRLNETDKTQPAIFAIQVGLAALWRSWGVEPDAVVGQSLGEIAAAHAAGVLSLEDALRIVVHRSRLMKRIEGLGKTAVIGLPPDAARLKLAGYEDSLAVAGCNSPGTCVISGDRAALETVLAALDQEAIFCRVLPGVDVAFHSPQVKPLEAELVEALDALKPGPAAFPIYSTVRADVIAGSNLNAAYWGQNLSQPFWFAAVIEKLIREGYTMFLEISPHPVLQRAVQEGLAHAEREGFVWSSLRRQEGGREVLFASLGAWYTCGGSVNWKRLQLQTGQRVSLPTYPWQRERYWFDQLDTGQPAYSSNRRKSDAGAPLLGPHQQLFAVPGAHVWEMDLNAHSVHILAHHRIQGAVVFPGAAYVEMALSGAGQIFARPLVIEDITFQQPLVLPDRGWRCVQLLISQVAAGEASFAIASQSADLEGQWIQHASGTIHFGADRLPPSVETLDSIQSRCEEALLATEHYQRLEAQGLQYGDSFRRIAHLHRCPGEALAYIHLPDDLAAELAVYQFHPTLLDAGFQTVAAAYTSAEAAANGDTYLPVGFHRLHIYTPPPQAMWCHVRRRSTESAQDGLQIADIWFLDPEGCPVASVEGLHLRRLAEAASAQRRNPRDWLYALKWQPIPSRASSSEPGAFAGRWLIFADRSGVGQALAERLKARGGQCTLVFAGANKTPSQGSRSWTVKPSRPTAFQQLMDSFQRDNGPCRGVLYLWGLDAPPPDQSSRALFEGIASSCQGVLNLTQALVRREWRERPKLWLITRGAQAVNGETATIGLSQAPLWGMGRVLAREHPEFWGGLVDLGSKESEADLESLAAICSCSTSEDAFAIRGEQHYVPRLLRHDQALDQKPRLDLRADSSYLITGGFGALGLQVAQWLVTRGARRLILLGRTPLPPRAQWDSLKEGTPLAASAAAIRRLEKLGATVYVAAVDVAERTQVAGFLTAYERSGGPPIRGVIHAAGILQDRLALQMTSEDLRAVLRPKILGAWNLHQLLEEDSLDFFVVFSSAASLLGQTGQANYAAANAFLDALAHYRRRTTSLNWGVWAGAGMAARGEVREQFEREGMFAFPPEAALMLMGQLVAQSETQAAVISADWSQLLRAAGGRWPLLEELGRESSELIPISGGAPSASPLVEQWLLAADPAEQRALLSDALRGLIAQVLRLGTPARLPVDLPLTALGFDSIMAMELRKRIGALLPVTLSIADLIVGPSVNELVEKLNGQLEADECVVELLARVEGASPQEVETLLGEGDALEGQPV